MADGIDSNVNVPNPPSPPAPKPRWRRRRVIAAVVLLAIVSAFLVHALTAVKEPVYQGKRLSAWLNDTHSASDMIGGEVLSPAAEQAIRAIGTNALPYLLKMIRTWDSKFQMFLLKFIPQSFHFHISTHMDDRVRAMNGFRTLGTAAQPAFHELAHLILNSDFDPYKIYSLENADADTIALLADGLHSPDTKVRRRAIFALTVLTQAPAIAVPALTKALNDPDLKVKANVADALGQYGPLASSAIPALTGLTNAVDSDLREAATEALGSIDINAPPTPPGMRFFQLPN